MVRRDRSGITTNYLLLPVSFMLMAIAVDLYAMLIAVGAPATRFSVPSRVAALPVSSSLAARSLAISGVAPDRSARLEAARPTIMSPGIDEIRDGLQPIGSHRLHRRARLPDAGRPHRRWLALDDYVRERFLVRRGDAPVAGVYTGVPAAFRPADLFAPNARRHAARARR